MAEVEVVEVDELCEVLELVEDEMEVEDMLVEIELEVVEEAIELGTRY